MYLERTANSGGGRYDNNVKEAFTQVREQARNGEIQASCRQMQLISIGMRVSADMVHQKACS